MNLQNRFFGTVLSFFFLLATISLSGQNPLTLSEAIEIGLQNNLQLRIADQSIAIAKNNNHWGTAGRYPTVNFNLTSPNGFTDQNNPASPALPEFTSVSTGGVAELSANWVLFDGFRVQITKEQLEMLETQSEASAAITAETIIQNIILAYYQAQIQLAQLEVLDEVKNLSKDRVDYQEVRKEFGQSVTFDILQSKDAYLNDSTNYLNQLNNYQIAIRNLNLAMGQEELNQRYDLVDRLEFEAPDYDLLALQERMLANNKNLERLFVERELAEINTRLQESTKSPTIGLGAGTTYNLNVNKINAVNPFTGEEFGTAVGRTFNANLNLTISYSIYNGGQRKRSIENAKMNEIIALTQIDDQKRMLNAELENVLATYNNQREVFELTNELLQNAEQNLQIAEERFKGGLINSFDYRSIQLSYINASQSRLTALFNLRVTETDLIRLIGGLVRE